MEPGDRIITGAPSGVGQSRTSPIFMKGGNMCEIEIEGIGLLRNSTVDEENCSHLGGTVRKTF